MEDPVSAMKRKGKRWRKETVIEADGETEEKKSIMERREDDVS